MDPLQQQLMMRAQGGIAPGQDDPNTPANMMAHPKSQPMGMDMASLQALLAKLKGMMPQMPQGNMGGPAPMGGPDASGPASAGSFVSGIGNSAPMQGLKGILGRFGG